MQVPTHQPSSHTGGSPRDPVHFFKGTDDALLFDVRCYAAAASNGPIVIPVSASRPEEAAEFFRQGVRKVTRLQTSTVQTPPSRHGKGPDAQNSTTFFCDSTGVRLQGCSLYSIANCEAGLFEVPEKPSDSYLRALEILRGPTSEATKHDPNPMTVTQMGRTEYQPSCNPSFYAHNPGEYPRYPSMLPRFSHDNVFGAHLAQRGGGDLPRRRR